MPEGDSLRHAAERVGLLAGEAVRVETPHPRAAALRLADRLDGKRLERVEATGKNLLLTFEGELVLRSHLRMRGRWRVGPAGERVVGTPWLVLRGSELQAVQWNGPVLELGEGRPDLGLGPDIMGDPPELEAMVARLRASGRGRELGEALLDQRLVAGIGNVWRAEALFAAGVSPLRRVAGLSDEELHRVFAAAAALMKAPRSPRLVYRRAGRPCRRCGAAIRSQPQGDSARIAYWCPGCQAGTDPASA